MSAENQATFDHVSLSLAKQGRPSADVTPEEVRCLYRAPNGDRCAAGHCFEGTAGIDFQEDSFCTNERIAVLLAAAGHNPLFVREMQRVHDNAARMSGGEPVRWLQEWAKGMRRLATRENLSTAVLDAALAGKVD
jgi:hypothetical protein